MFGHDAPYRHLREYASRRKRQLRRILFTCGGVVTLVLATIFGLHGALRIVNIQTVKTYIETKISKETGRECRIEGDIVPVFGLLPSLALHDLRLANTAWGSSPNMLRVDEAIGKVNILSLLSGKIAIDSLNIKGLYLILEESPKGEVNWHFTPSPRENQPEEEAAASKLFPADWMEASLHVDARNVNILYRSEKQNRKTTLMLKSLALDSQNLSENSTLALDGSIEQHSFSAKGTLGGIPLWRNDQPWPWKWEAAIADATLNASGTLRSKTRSGEYELALKSADPQALFALAGVALPELDGLDLTAKGPFAPQQISASDFTLNLHRNDMKFNAKGSLNGIPSALSGEAEIAMEGRNLALLGETLGHTWPSVGPYHLLASTKASPGEIALSKFSASLGKSSFGGLGSFAYASTPMKLNASIAGPKLIWAELFPPQKDAKSLIPLSALSPISDAYAAEAAAKLFSDSLWPLESLQLIDADIRLNIQELQLPKLTLTGFDTRLVLQQGGINLAPLTFATAGGTVSAQFGFTMATGAPHWLLQATGKHLDSTQLADALVPLLDLSGSRVDMEVNLQAAGRSAQALASSLDGTVSLALSEGRYKLPLIAGSATGVLQTLAGGKEARELTLHCGSGTLAFNGGRGDLRMALDTTGALAVAQGSVLLPEERLDITLRPLPKDAALKSLAVPIIIRGPLTSPDMALDTLGTAAAAGGLFALFTDKQGLAKLLQPQVTSGSPPGLSCSDRLKQALASHSKPETASETVERIKAALPEPIQKKVADFGSHMQKTIDTELNKLLPMKAKP